MATSGSSESGEDGGPRQPLTEGGPKSLDSYLNSIGTTAHQWGMVVVLGLCNSADATEILSMGYIIADDSFKPMLSRASGSSSAAQDEAAGWLTASVFVGMLVGGILTGVMGDYLGRRPTLIAGLTLNAISGLIASTMPTLAWLAVARFFCGVGVGSTNALFTLAAELMPRENRGFFITVVSWFWMVGTLFTAGAALLIFRGFGLSWRYFMVVCTIPSIVSVTLFYFIIPESPRYLALRGRYDEAAAVANKIARRSGHTGAGIRPRAIEGRGAGIKERCKMTMSQLWEESKRNVRTLYTRSTLRRALLGLQITWFCFSFGAWGLSVWITPLFKKLGLRDPLISTLIFSASDVPGAIAGGLLIERIGRRASLFGAMTIAAMSIGLFAVAVSGSTLGSLVLFAACLYEACAFLSWSALDCLSAEGFPTELRSSAVGLLAATGRLGAMSAQFVNGALIGTPSLLLSVTAGMLFLGMLGPCASGSPDMSNQPLDDAIELVKTPRPSMDVVIRDAGDEKDMMDMASGEIGDDSIDTYQSAA